MNEDKTFPDCRGDTQCLEDAFLKVIRGVGSVWAKIDEAACAEPSADENVQTTQLFKNADGIAKLMKPSSEALNLAGEGLHQVWSRRAEKAAKLANAGQSPGANGSHEEDYPLRAEMEAYDRVLQSAREGKP